jgi:NAD(P)H dehydrogenase (quinone)
MDVLPTYAVYGSGELDGQSLADARQAWRSQAARIFQDSPIAFRPQNGGDYPDSHVLADPVAPGQIGLMAHVMSPAEQRARAGHAEGS